MERTQKHLTFKKTTRDQLREQEKSSQYTHHSFTPPPYSECPHWEEGGYKKKKNKIQNRIQGGNNKWAFHSPHKRSLSF